MNSMLQCLLNTSPLREYFSDSEYKSCLKTRSGLAATFAELVNDVWSGKRSSISPSTMKRQIEKHNPQFKGYRQHDSHELLLSILDGIHEELNSQDRSKQKYRDLDKLPLFKKAEEAWVEYNLRDRSMLVDIFVGQMISTLTCQSCDEISTVCESFWDLSVPLGDNTSSCLKKFTNEELLDGDERPKCDKCNKRRAMLKQYKLWRLPKILVVQLKRFTGSGRIRSKDSRMVELESEIDCKKLLHEESPHKTKTIYRLYAVSNHMGGTGGGHYTASCKHFSSDNWRYFNDSSVSDISASRIQTSDAYVLFYERL